MMQPLFIWVPEHQNQYTIWLSGYLAPPSALY